MAITTPFSVELTKNEDAISIVEGAVVDSVAEKLKVFLGVNVNPGSPQVYIGTLKACFRHAMNERFKNTASAGAAYIHGDWQNASAGNIQISTLAVTVGDDDVAISVAGNFETQAATHFYTETFDQLIDGLLERTKDN